MQQGRRGRLGIIWGGGVCNSMGGYSLTVCILLEVTVMVISLGDKCFFKIAYMWLRLGVETLYMLPRAWSKTNGKTWADMGQWRWAGHATLSGHQSMSSTSWGAFGWLIKLRLTEIWPLPAHPRNGHISFISLWHKTLTGKCDVSAVWITHLVIVNSDRSFSCKTLFFRFIFRKLYILL